MPEYEARIGETVVSLLKIGCGRPRVHGNGFIQLDLTPNMRLHVWGDPRIPKQATHTPLHNHTFSFTSYVLVGALRDELFEAVPSDIGPYQPHRAVTRRAEDTVLVPEGGRVNISVLRTRTIRAGGTYDMQAGWIHESTPLEPSISVIVKDGPSLAQGGIPPLVFVPVGVVPSNEFDRYAAAPEALLWQIIGDVLNAALPAGEDVALQVEPVKEPMKLRTASQVLGWMDSVGPLTYAPGHPVTADAAICESRSPDGDKLADASMRGVGQRAGYEPERLGDAASVNAQQVTEAGSNPADSHQPIPAVEASPSRPIGIEDLCDALADAELPVCAEHPDELFVCPACQEAEAEHQIATLTKARDFQRQRADRGWALYEKTLTKLVDLEEIDLLDLREQIATLTAERDQLQADLYGKPPYRPGAYAQIELEIKVRDEYLTRAEAAEARAIALEAQLIEAERQRTEAEAEIWEDVLRTVRLAWSEPGEYLDSPLELIVELIEQRDDLQVQVSDLERSCDRVEDEKRHWVGMLKDVTALASEYRDAKEAAEARVTFVEGLLEQVRQEQVKALLTPPPPSQETT